jgi:hypothetical protein
MARILVTSAGYRGDVLPFVSVSRELARGDTRSTWSYRQGSTRPWPTSR